MERKRRQSENSSPKFLLCCAMLYGRQEFTAALLMILFHLSFLISLPSYWPRLYVQVHVNMLCACVCMALGDGVYEGEDLGERLSVISHVTLGGKTEILRFVT